MSDRTDREPELSNARVGMEKLFVYVLTNPADTKYGTELLDIAHSRAEAQQLAAV